MTIEQKIGQLMCCGWSEPDCCLNLNTQARRLVTDLQVGGILLMGRNVQRSDAAPSAPVDAAAVRRMTAELQTLAGPTPLLIATDQEGGRVQRLRGSTFTRLPSGAQVGAAGRAAGVGHCARASRGRYRLGFRPGL